MSNTDKDYDDLTRMINVILQSNLARYAKLSGLTEDQVVDLSVELYASQSKMCAQIHPEYLKRHK